MDAEILKKDDARLAKQLSKLNKMNDPEAAHCEADNLLCEVLEILGYKKTVRAFEKLTKFYA